MSKSERTSNIEGGKSETSLAWFGSFGFRYSDLFRISTFGFRISPVRYSGLRGAGAGAAVGLVLGADAAGGVLEVGGGFPGRERRPVGPGGDGPQGPLARPGRP